MINTPSKRISFCKNLAKIRESKGFTQQQVANIIGITQSVYARLESAKHSPSLDILIKIAEALSCEIDIIEK